MVHGLLIECAGLGYYRDEIEGIGLIDDQDVSLQAGCEYLYIQTCRYAARDPNP